MRRRLLMSLHDVTPYHFARLVRAEHCLASAGVRRATYLLVPRFHGAWPVEQDNTFVAWCRAPRALEVCWFLHGFFHSETTEPAAARKTVGLPARIRGRYMTAAEGEFLRLEGDELRRRLERGVAAFRACLRRRPAGFVPPAWLANDELLPALRRLGVAVAEDHRWVYDVAAGQRRPIPVITWATRTPFRRVASRVLAPLLLELWSSRPVIRIAIHPSDVDHPATLRSIEQVVASALRDREPAFYEELSLSVDRRPETVDRR